MGYFNSNISLLRICKNVMHRLSTSTSKNSLFLSAFILVSCLTFLRVAPASADAAVWYTGSNPPAGYLANPGNNAGGLEHILNDAISSDIDTTVPADYCNAYNTALGSNNAPLMYQNNLDQSSFTGFNPGTPLADWQEGDAGSYNVCQAKGTTWGFKVTGALNSNCTPNVACGMHHFARLSGGQSNLPWSGTYGTVPAPALTFSLNVKPQVANYTQGVFGYFCPVLQDITTGNYIEYCFVEWQKGSGYPAISHFDQLGACATTPSQHNVDTIFTAFSSNQTWSTQRAGSANTFGTVPNNVYMSASISAQNLRNAIAVINSPVGPAPNHDGCNRGISTDVKNYALVGFEHGMEGGGFSALGGSVSNEKLSTTTDTLYPDNTLESGKTMYASSGGYKVVMQADGNLVTYNAGGTPLWSSGTYGNSGARLTMQSDGNLVIYRTNGSAAWSSNTSGNSGAYTTVQADGNFVVYKGAQYKWSSF